MQIRVFQAFVSAQLKVNASLWSDNEVVCGPGSKLVSQISHLIRHRCRLCFGFLTWPNNITHVGLFCRCWNSVLANRIQFKLILGVCGNAAAAAHKQVVTVPSVLQSCFYLSKFNQQILVAWNKVLHLIHPRLAFAGCLNVPDAADSDGQLNRQWVTFVKVEEWWGGWRGHCAVQWDQQRAGEDTAAFVEEEDDRMTLDLPPSVSPRLERWIHVHSQRKHTRVSNPQSTGNKTPGNKVSEEASVRFAPTKLQLNLFPPEETPQTHPFQVFQTGPWSSKPFINVWQQSLQTSVSALVSCPTLLLLPHCSLLPVFQCERLNCDAHLVCVRACVTQTPFHLMHRPTTKRCTEGGTEEPSDLSSDHQNPPDALLPHLILQAVSLWFLLAGSWTLNQPQFGHISDILENEFL